MKVGIIGAGASGMAAALQAAWAGAEVTLFERNPAPGRKLLVTGSGRCNLTNNHAAAGRYTCADPAWMAALLGAFGVSDLLAMLDGIGVPAHKTPDGWYYPLSDSAHSVVAAFGSALALAGVKLLCDARVTGLRAGGEGHELDYTQGGELRTTSFARAIISSGGMAHPELGAGAEVFEVLAHLGHTLLPPRPALAPVLAELGSLRALRGVRLDAGVTIWEGKKRIAESLGNLIFTEWGLNGPAVMDISHHISARPGARLELSLNFLAPFGGAFERLLTQKRGSRMPVRVLLGAFFPPKAVRSFIISNQIETESALGDLPESALNRLVGWLGNARLRVKGVRGFEHCQVSAGGVPVSEADPLTLESRKFKGLYLTGETLDAVGPCGGYNLQFAFSSGALAGMAAARA
jgi:hypothetical protein